MSGSFPPREARRVAALLALASLAIGALWSVESASAVERWTEVRVLDPWGERGTFTYEPLLSDGSDASDGTGALPMGEPGYFTTDAPRVRLQFTWRLEDPAAERVSALGTLSLVAAREASAGAPAWRHVETLGNGTLAGDPEEPLVLTGVVDLAALAEQIGASRLDGATWEVRAAIRFASTPHAHHAAEESLFILPLEHTPPLYSLPPVAALETTKDHAGRESIPHEARAGLSGLRAQPLGPILALVGLLGVHATREPRPQEEPT